MYCPACGTDIGDAANFCSKCGKPTSISQASGHGGAAVATAPSPVQTSPPKKKSHAAAWVLIAILLGILWVFVSNAPKDNAAANQVRQIATGHPLSTPVTVSLFNAPFTLEPGHYMRSEFTIPSNAHDVHLDGHFSASGGAGNDVEAFILDADGFTNWQNHHSTRTYYNSQKTTTGTVAARLPDTTTNALTYYMVFSNTFSLLSNKAVDANVTLNYER